MRNKRSNRRPNRAQQRRPVSPAGRFINYLRAKGFERVRGVRMLGCDIFQRKRDNQQVLIDYYPKRGALLIVDGESHVIWYDETPNTTNTRG